MTFDEPSWTIDDAIDLVVEGAGGGGKGGKGASGGKESPNTLQSKAYARLLFLLGEGQIKGLVNGGQGIIINKVPFANGDGTYNFSGVQFFSKLGTADQTALPGFPAVTTEFNINARVRSTQGVTYRTEGSTLDAVVVTLNLPSLSKLDDSTGNLNGYSVAIAIDIRQASGGTWVTKVQDTISGKNTSPYERGYRIDLEGTGPWLIRMRRLSPDSDSDVKISDDTYFGHITEITDFKVGYANSAIVGVEIDSEALNGGEFRFDTDGKADVKYPSNYNPVTRTYTGFWDGTWTVGFTDNPAWVFFDLATNVRYGARIPEALVDKWGLYQLAKFCDELVPDGYGGTEPRFVFNGTFYGAEEAYKVLQGVASMMRAIVFYAAGAVIVRADLPNTVQHKLYTPANTIGDFSYAGTAKNVRHNACTVQFENPELGYEDDFVVYEDRANILKYGYNNLSISAIGTKSASQAYRQAKWAVLTNLLQTDTITFNAGRDSSDTLPGDIVEVADPHWATADFGGRVVQDGTANGTTQVKLDRPIDYTGATSPQLHLTLLTGATYDDIANVDNTDRPARREVRFFSSNITAYDAVTNVVTLQTAIPNDGNDDVTPLVWIFSKAQVAPRKYKVISNEENVEEKSYQISALNYDPAKFTLIDENFKVDSGGSNYTDLPEFGTALPPKNLQLGVRSEQQGTSITRHLVGSWTASPTAGVQEYEVRVYRDNENASIFRTKYTNFDIPAELGNYRVQVLAVSMFGALSAAITQSIPITESTATGQAPGGGIVGPQTGTVFNDRALRAYWTSRPLSLTSRTGDISVGIARPQVTSTINGEGDREFNGANDAPASTGTAALNLTNINSPTVTYTGTFNAQDEVWVTIDNQRFAYVNTTASATASAIATAIANVINAHARYNATASAGVVTIAFVDGANAGQGLTGSADPLFKRYKVEVYNSAGTVLKRTAYTQTESYTYTIEDNLADFAGVPARSIMLKVYVEDIYGGVSLPDTQTLTNAAPIAPAVSFQSSGQSANMLFATPNDPDYAGVEVHLGTNTEFTPTSATLVHDGMGTPSFPVKPLTTYVVKYRFYDVFDKANIPFSSAQFTAADIVSGTVSLSDIIFDVNDLKTNGTGADAETLAARDAAIAARDAAQLANTNAQTAKTDAQAAVTAAEQAETDALAAASAASGHATTASNHKDAAAGSASAASGSATTANTKAGEASVSAGNAATSATNASGSASNAASSATTAAQSRDTAAGHASAAATSASTASTKAGEASTSASAANTSATNASTSAGTASTKATEASTSASNALGSANTASLDATVAASSKTAAEAAAAKAGPRSIGAGSQYFLSYNNSITFLTSHNIPVARNLDASPKLWPKHSVPAIPGRTYRAHMSWRNEGAGNKTDATVGLDFVWLDNVSNGVGSVAGAGPVVLVEAEAAFPGYRRIYRQITLPANPTTQNISAYWDGYSMPNYVELRDLWIEDVTAQVAAQGSADAAATSASTATTKASEAGQSATAASGSATTATTKAGEASTSAGQASTSAGQASTSASNASGSASGAASSATLAASSAYDAGGAAVNQNKVPALSPSTWASEQWSIFAPTQSVTTSPNVTVVGRALRVVHHATNNIHIHPRPVTAIVANRQYRFRFDILRQVQPTINGDVYGYICTFDASNAVLDVFALGYVRFTGTFETTVGLPGSGAAWITSAGAKTARLLVRFDYGNGTTDLTFAELVDISSEVAASGSATAAANSASTAATSATNAGNSATSATNSSNLAAAYANPAGLIPNGNLDLGAVGWALDNYGWASEGSPYFTRFRSTPGTYGTIFGAQKISVDTSRKYELIVDFGVYASATQIFYAGLTCYSATGANLGNVYMTNFSAATFAAGTISRRSQVYSGVGPAAPSYGAGTQFIQGTATVTPLFFGNYPNPSAIAGAYSDLMGMQLYDVTEREAAAGSASAAATSSTSASGSATSAGNSASSATTSANAASTSAGNASTSAGNANTSAANASSSAASALTSMQLSASVTGNSLVKNPTFTEYTTATSEVPDYWRTADHTNLVANSRIVGPLGIGYAWRQSPGGSADCYAAQLIPANVIKPSTWYVIEVDLKITGGTLAGSGVYFHDGNGPHAMTLPFINMPYDGKPVGVFQDTGGYGNTGSVYRFRQIVQTTPLWLQGNTCYFYIMSQWGSGFGVNPNPKTLDFYRASIRPATPSEVSVGKASGLDAAVTQMQGVLATNAGRANAFWQVQTNAGTAETFITAQSSSSDPAYLPVTIDHQGKGLTGALVRNGSTIARNSLIENSTNWTYAVASKESYTGGAYMAFTIGRRDDDQVLMAGLGPANPTTYEHISFAAYYHASAGGSQIPYEYVYESGNYRQGTQITWKATDFVEVEYRGAVAGGRVTYKRNGVTYRTVDNVGANLTLHFNVVLYYANASITNVVFGPKAPTKISTVAIGASEIQLFNANGSGQYIKALTVSGGNAVFSGGLQAGAYIKLGNGEGWPVALKPRNFQVSDGDVVSFGTTLDALPLLAWQKNNLVALTTGETYNTYAENLTTTGFTVRAKIITPAAPANYELTTSTTPGTGPTRQIDKSANPNATDGNYTLSYAGYMYVYGYYVGGGGLPEN